MELFNKLESKRYPIIFNICLDKRHFLLNDFKSVAGSSQLWKGIRFPEHRKRSGQEKFFRYEDVDIETQGSIALSVSVFF